MVSNIFNFVLPIVVKVIYESEGIGWPFVSGKMQAVYCMVFIKTFSEYFNLFRIYVVMWHIQMNQRLIVFESFRPLFSSLFIKRPLFLAWRQFILVISFLSSSLNLFQPLPLLLNLLLFSQRYTWLLIPLRHLMCFLSYCSFPKHLIQRWPPILGKAYVAKWDV